MTFEQKAAKIAKRFVDRRYSLSPSLPLLASVPILLFFLLFPLCVQAEVAPVAVRVPEGKVWIGQRLPFYVELRAPGSFAGTAGFDLPQLPGTFLMKIGNPVVGSQEIEGESWFVQTHEFALFSQRPGTLEVPPFSVRFASREGFTGPTKEMQAKAPSWKVDIRRPPGSDKIGFLITSESLDITEKWDPQPGPAQVGAMFKRTIVQRATQITGMALAPAPTTVPDGIRIYPDDPEIKDKLERGDFLGERRETITYLLQKPGTLAVPALTYAWWNPKTETLQSKTLPAVTFEVAPAPSAATPAKAGADRVAWPWLVAAILVVGLGVWQKRRIGGWGRQCWNTLNSPDRAAARKLLRACRRHDALAAETAWIAWRKTQDAAFQPRPELRSTVLGLQRHLFGPASGVTWQGDDLARAFGENFTAAKVHSARKVGSALPLLNPRP
jgi:hypothetical protein